MAAVFYGRMKHFLSAVFMLAILVFFARASSTDVIEKPKFKYFEKMLVKATFEKATNSTLYICCTDTKLKKFERITCQHISLCDDGYEKLLSCDTKGRQVCCQIDRVLPNLTIKGFVAWVDRNGAVASSDVATYVTNSEEKIPKSVSNVAVSTNSNQGLTIRWDQLTRRDYSSKPETYSYVVDCKPLENKRAKAVREDVELKSNSKLIVDSTNLTAVCKYRCCVQVVNVVTSLGSELSCQNVTTSEQAPSASPVIVCGNETACPSVIKGMRRNVTLLFQSPIVGKRNGKIVRHEIYYKNATSAVNTTKLIVLNGSATEAQITNIESGTSYVVYMKSCTEVGCSPVSNTVRIPAVSQRTGFFQAVTHPAHETPVAVIAGSVASICIVVVIVIAVVLKRHQNQQRKTPLEGLQLPNSAYENAENTKKDDGYDVLDASISDIPDVKDDQNCTIMSNKVALQTAC